MLERPAPKENSMPNVATALLRRFDEVRTRTRALSVSLSGADASAQSMPGASPVKWHLAHTN